MNEPLITAAKHGLSDPHFITLPHRCQQWLRQVVQSVYGSQFDDFWKGSAATTGRCFQHSPYAVPLANGSQPGDILYKLKGSGGDGHVGIRLPGNLVAENSSVHWDGRDARGTRTLKEFGNFDLIVRLPPPKSLRPRVSNTGVIDKRVATLTTKVV
jgi:hypothetical protein